MMTSRSDCDLEGTMNRSARPGVVSAAFYKTASIGIGLFLALVLLESGMRLTGALLLRKQHSFNQKNLFSPSTIRVLCLGESTTADLGNSNHSWPEYLQAILDDSSTSYKFKIINEGRTGTFLATIIDRLESNLQVYDPHFVVAMIGINDVSGVVYKLTLLDRYQGWFSRFRVYKLFNLLLKRLQSPRPPASAAGSSPAQAGGKVDRRLEQAQTFLLTQNLEAAYTILRELYLLDPQRPDVILALATYFDLRGSYAEADTYYFTLTQRYPTNAQYWFAVGNSMLKRYENLTPDPPPQARDLLLTAGQLLAKAVELDKASTKILATYGFYLLHIDSPKALETLRQVINRCTGTCDGLAKKLAKVFIAHAQYADAEKACQLVVKANPLFEAPLWELGNLYIAWGQPEKASQAYDRAAQIRKTYLDSRLGNAYLRIYGALRKRGTKLFMMQYPLRDVAALRHYFTGLDGVSFISNQENFAAALETHPYDRLFVDRFAGDFGHATSLGNQLIAQNVAAALLEYTRTTFVTDN